MRVGVALMSYAIMILLSLLLNWGKRNGDTDLRRNRSATLFSPTSDAGTFFTVQKIIDEPWTTELKRHGSCHGDVGLLWAS